MKILPKRTRRELYFWASRLKRFRQPIGWLFPFPHGETLLIAWGRDGFTATLRREDGKQLSQLSSNCLLRAMTEMLVRFPELAPVLDQFRSPAYDRLVQQRLGCEYDPGSSKEAARQALVRILEPDRPGVTARVLALQASWLSGAPLATGLRWRALGLTWGQGSYAQQMLDDLLYLA